MNRRIETAFWMAVGSGAFVVLVVAGIRLVNWILGDFLTVALSISMVLIFVIAVLVDSATEKPGE